MVASERKHAHNLLCWCSLDPKVVTGGGVPETLWPSTALQQFAVANGCCHCSRVCDAKLAHVALTGRKRQMGTAARMRRWKCTRQTLPRKFGRTSSSLTLKRLCRLRLALSPTSLSPPTPMASSPPRPSPVCLSSAPATASKLNADEQVFCYSMPPCRVVLASFPVIFPDTMRSGRRETAADMCLCTHLLDAIHSYQCNQG